MNKPLKKPVTPNTGALELITKRNDWYRDMSRSLASATPILAIALLASVGLNIMQANRDPIERYFAIDGAGRITKIAALSEPFITDAYLNNWVSEKVSMAYTMDAQNYQRQVGALEPHFTPEGFEQYRNSLVDSGTIESITKNVLIMSSTPMNVPVVVSRGLANGVMFWKVRVPVLVSFKSAIKGTERRRIVEVTVMRRHTIESPDGIGISQFVATDI